MFEAWQLTMIAEAGYNGMNVEGINRVARAIKQSGKKEKNHLVIR